MGLVGLASLACLDVCVPKGRRFAQRRATPWLQKPFTAPPFFPLRSFGPTGQPFSCGFVRHDGAGVGCVKHGSGRKRCVSRADFPTRCLAPRRTIECETHRFPPGSLHTPYCGIGMVGPLGRKGMEKGRMDYLGAATRLPGRRPSLDERLGLRPACGSACVPGLSRAPSVPSARLWSGGLTHGSCRPRISGVPRRVRPEGASVLPAKGDALDAEAVHRPTVFSPPFLRPNGPTVLRERGVRSPRTPSEPHRNRLLRAGGPFTVLSAAGGLRPVVHDG
jgi:hypothetical protein